jgi:uncharacterized delta-60 repeat protein
MRITVFLLATALLPAAAIGSDGVLDPGFGNGGIVEIGWPAGSATANAIGLDTEHRILVGGDAIGASGDSDFALFRLLPDGTLDTTYASDGGGFRLIDFNLDGIGSSSDDVINDLAMYPDGALVALGEAHSGFAGVNSQYALSRVNGTGALDTSFGDGGSVHFGSGSFATIDYGLRIALDAQQRIVTAGRIAVYHDNTLSFDWWLGLARLTSQGQFDSTFYGGGFYWTFFWADPNIPPPRHSLFNVPLALAFDASQRVLTAGVVQQPIPFDAAICRAPADGGYDDSFAQQSRLQLGLSEGEASALRPLPAGGMLVAGGYATGSGTYGLFLARRQDDGSADASFGTSGITTIPLAHGFPEPSLIASTHHGGWLVAGQLTEPQGGVIGVVLARFDAQGHPQPGFGDGGVVTVGVPDGRPFSAGRVALQSDGKLVVAGSLPAPGPDTTPHFAVMRIIVDEFLFADGFDGS